MNARSLLSAMCVIAAVALATQAAAQDAPRWRDPTRSWSIDLASNNWVRGDGYDNEAIILVAVPRAEPAQGEVNLCVVLQYGQTLPRGGDETEIRMRAATFDEGDVRDAFPNAALQDVQVTHTMLGDQSVALVEATSRGDRFHGRVFVTPAPGQALLSTIGCIISPGIAPEGLAETDAVLNSLQFHAPVRK